MSRKRYTPEQIISMLREAEVALAQGQSVGQACRTLGVSEQSYYRWRKEYGGLRTDQAKRLKDLEKENGRLRIELRFPQVSMGVLEGDVVEWLVEVGASVAAGQTLVVIETGKTTVEIESPVDGTFEAILVVAGANAKVGDVLGHITPG